MQFDIADLIENSKSAPRIKGLKFREFTVRITEHDYQQFRKHLDSLNLYAGPVVSRMIEAFNQHCAQ